MTSADVWGTLVSMSRDDHRPRVSKRVNLRGEHISLLRTNDTQTQRTVGVSDEDLRLVIVHDHAANEDHAVTAVRYERRWLILDNKTFDIRQDDGIAHYDPLFVIDSNGVKRAEARVPKSQNPSSDARATASKQLWSGWQNSVPVLL